MEQWGDKSRRGRVLRRGDAQSLTPIPAAAAAALLLAACFFWQRRERWEEEDAAAARNHLTPLSANLPKFHAPPSPVPAAVASVYTGIGVAGSTVVTTGVDLGFLGERPVGAGFVFEFRSRGRVPDTEGFSVCSVRVGTRKDRVR